MKKPNITRKRLIKEVEAKLLSAEQSQLSSAMIAQALIWHFEVESAKIGEIVREYLGWMEAGKPVLEAAPDVSEQLVAPRA